MYRQRLHVCVRLCLSRLSRHPSQCKHTPVVPRLQLCCDQSKSGAKCCFSSTVSSRGEQHKPHSRGMYCLWKKYSMCHEIIHNDWITNLTQRMNLQIYRLNHQEMCCVCVCVSCSTSAVMSPSGMFMSLRKKLVRQRLLSAEDVCTELLL